MTTLRLYRFFHPDEVGPTFDHIAIARDRDHALELIVESWCGDLTREDIERDCPVTHVYDLTEPVVLS